VVEDKTARVRNFHAAMLHSLAEITAAAGLAHPCDFRPEHFTRRVSEREVLSFADLYPRLPRGVLLQRIEDPQWRRMWEQASADRFGLTA
jgi:hypothetical protein